LLVVDRFHASPVELLGVFSCCVDITTIGIGAMTSKTITTTKFEVEKFDGKSNFLLWKMRVTSLFVKEDTQKAMFGAKKPSKMEDDE